jgi:hypothetical protein
MNIECADQSLGPLPSFKYQYWLFGSEREHYHEQIKEAPSLQIRYPEIMKSSLAVAASKFTSISVAKRQLVPEREIECRRRYM